MQGAERSQSGLTPPGLTPAERELEDALCGLSPAAAPIDRDRLLFEAGVAAGRAGARRRLGWAAGALAVGLGVAVAWRPQPETQERLASDVPRTPVRVDSTHAEGRANPALATSSDTAVAMTPVPIPVPGGPFVAVPGRLVSVMTANAVAGGGPTAAYLSRLQSVLERTMDARPRTRTTPRGADPGPGTPAFDSGDPAANPSVGESHPS
jgi:hypothetical protein